MTGNTVAIGISVIALAVSALFAAYGLIHERRLAGGGFRTAEDLKVDIVALRAALVSAIYKGIQAVDRKEPRDVSAELERVRAFQSSPSGYALVALAAKRGSTDSDPHAGMWRTLG